MITAPGIYTDMTAAEYHADCCPAPSLTQSVAKILLERSPLHAWHAHPKLNPDYQHNDDTKFDIGNVAHKLLLGRGKEIVALDAPDWNATGMGKGAKTKLHEERDALRAAGKVAVLGKTVARADRMVKAAREQLELRGLGHLFGEHGNGEVVVAWKEDGMWLRQMIDWLDSRRLIFADYKTTDESAAPAALARKMVNDGWHIQAAMAKRGLDIVDDPLDRQYLFVVQEATVPYALSVVEINRDALAMGHKMLEYAATQWKICVGRNCWPGYPLDVTTPEFPGWAEQQWLDREIKEAARERIPEDLRAAG